MKQVTLITAAMLALLVLAVRAGDKKVNVSKIHGKIQYVKVFPTTRCRP